MVLIRCVTDRKITPHNIPLDQECIIHIWKCSAVSKEPEHDNDVHICGILMVNSIFSPIVRLKYLFKIQIGFLKVWNGIGPTVIWSFRKQ